jgi:hypothetical protein
MNLTDIHTSPMSQIISRFDILNFINFTMRLDKPMNLEKAKRSIIWDGSCKHNFRHSGHRPEPNIWLPQKSGRDGRMHYAVDIYNSISMIGFFLTAPDMSIGQCCKQTKSSSSCWCNKFFTKHAQINLSNAPQDIKPLLSAIYLLQSAGHPCSVSP